MEKDCRLSMYNGYLNGKKFEYRDYGMTENVNDHDHCELCFGKFSLDIESSLKKGYYIFDEKCDQSKWICEKCFNDFKDLCKFQVK